MIANAAGQDRINYIACGMERTDSVQQPLNVADRTSTGIPVLPNLYSVEIRDVGGIDPLVYINNL